MLVKLKANTLKIFRWELAGKSVIATVASFCYDLGIPRRLQTSAATTAVGEGER
jgi:hypothetical protein